MESGLSARTAQHANSFLDESEHQRGGMCRPFSSARTAFDRLTSSQGAFAQGGSVQRGKKVTQDRHGQKRDDHAASEIPGNVSIRT